MSPVIRQLLPSDIEAGMRLKAAAGWNQVRADWEALLQVEPDGCFAAVEDDEVVGTATAVGWDDTLGWIGMVLVDPAHRRKGIATQLMERAIAYLEARPCACIKLDATDDGAKVYAHMGFQYEYTVERWRRDPSAFRPPIEPAVRPISEADAPVLFDQDVAAFGADRSRLLRWYFEAPVPALAWIGADGSRQGYVCGRRGSGAMQMGPLVAGASAPAAALMSAFLAGAAGPVIADFPASNPWAADLLSKFGFVRSRVLQRMVRGDNRCPGDPAQVYCLAGFEWG